MRWAIRCARVLTGGEVADITQTPALIDGFNPQTVVADKGYDANAFVALINAASATAVIGGVTSFV